MQHLTLAESVPKTHNFRLLSSVSFPEIFGIADPIEVGRTPSSSAAVH